jgi:REP element-mobilizing transposase RayT
MRRKRNTQRYTAPWARKEVLADKSMGDKLSKLRGEPIIYHCISKIVDNRAIFGMEEKEHFVRILRNYEQFSGLKILAYCVMPNHFHLLIEVPEPNPEILKWSDDRLLKHLSVLYNEDQAKVFIDELSYLRKLGDEEEIDAYRLSIVDRMWDISKFMHDIKMRFSHWYNRRVDRDGYLWSANFRSTLVQRGHATRMVAAYIDLNAVRAELVEDPADYLWCSYGEAVAGSKKAREGLKTAIFGHPKPGSDEAETPGTWEEALQIYRSYLFPGKPKDEKPRDEDAPLSEAEMLRHRVSYFTRGLVVGTEEFVENAFELSRGNFSPRRQSGARKMREVETELRSMRDIRKNPITPPRKPSGSK